MRMKAEQEKRISRRWTSTIERIPRSSFRNGSSTSIWIMRSLTSSPLGMDLVTSIHGVQTKKFNELPHLKVGQKPRTVATAAVSTGSSTELDMGPHRGWSNKDYTYDDQNLPNHVDKDDFYHYGDINEAPMHA